MERRGVGHARPAAEREPDAGSAFAQRHIPRANQAGRVAVFGAAQRIVRVDVDEPEMAERPLSIDAVASFNRSVGRDAEQLARGSAALAHAHVRARPADQVLQVAHDGAHLEALELARLHGVKQNVPGLGKPVVRDGEAAGAVPAQAGRLEQGPAPARGAAIAKVPRDLQQVVLVGGRHRGQDAAGTHELGMLAERLLEEPVRAAAVRENAEAVVPLGRAVQRDPPGDAVRQGKVHDVLRQVTQVRLAAEGDPLAHARGQLFRGRDQIPDQRKAQHRLAAVKNHEQVRAIRIGRRLSLAAQGLFHRAQRDVQRHV